MTACGLIKFLFIVVSIALASPTAGRELVEGPVWARITKVRDGDSIDVVARVWPGHEVRVSVRIRGIDAPELRARCEKERELALRAKAGLISLISGDSIWLHNISGGKYYGRVLADVITHDQQNVGKTLMRRGLVRPYEGGKRQSWCPQSLALKQKK